MRILPSAAAVLLLLLVGRAEGAATTAPATLGPAPDFELPAAEGPPFALSRNGGVIRVLFFVRNNGKFISDALGATELVVNTAPIFLQKTVLVCIVGQSLEGADFETFRKQFKLKWILLHDRSEAVHRLYGVIAVPTVVVVNERGEIAGRLAGYSLAFGKEFRMLLSATLGIPDASTTHLSTATLQADRLVSLGDMMVARGLYESALANYLKAQEILPNLAPARSRAGFCYLRMTEVTTGTREFQKVLAADANSTAALVGMAWALALEGKVEPARAELEKLRPRADKMPEYYEAWAAVHRALGLRDEAKQDLSAAGQLRGHGVNAPVSLPKKGKASPK